MKLSEITEANLVDESASGLRSLRRGVDKLLSGQKDQGARDGLTEKRALLELMVERATSKVPPLVDVDFSMPRVEFTAVPHSNLSVGRVWKAWGRAAVERGGAVEIEPLTRADRAMVRVSGGAIQLKGESDDAFGSIPSNDMSQSTDELRDDVIASSRDAILECDVRIVDHAIQKVMVRDVLFMDGKDVRGLPRDARRAICDGIAKSCDAPMLDTARAERVVTRVQFIAAAKGLAQVPGARGVVMRTALSKHAGDGLEAQDAAVVRNAVRADLVVRSCRRSSGDDFDVGVEATASDAMKCETCHVVDARSHRVGSVIACMVRSVEVTEGEHDGTVRLGGVTAMLKSAVENPDTVTEVVLAAERAGIAVMPGSVKSAISDVLDASKAEGAGTREAVEGNLDFKEDDAGFGVVQEHGLGLSEEEAKAFARGVNRGTWSMHTDFRMVRTRPTRADYYEGGELFTPGNNRRGNRFLSYRGGSRIMMNFKVPSNASRRGGPPYVVHGDLKWMRYGSGKPRLIKPGESEADVETWGVIRKVESFDWAAGTQDRHYKEFRLSFRGKMKALSGRWIFVFARLGARRAWTAMRPGEQRMDAEREANEKVSI